MMFYRKLITSLFCGLFFMSANADCDEIVATFYNDSHSSWDMAGGMSADVPIVYSYTRADPGKATWVKFRAQSSFNATITFKKSDGASVIFSIWRGTNTDSLSGEVTSGYNYATRTSLIPNCGRGSLNNPSVDFEFLPVPIMQQVKVKIGFNSASQANFASRNLESLLDTSLLDSLDTKYGKPVDIEVVDKKQVELTFTKDCDNDACGYN